MFVVAIFVRCGTCRLGVHFDETEEPIVLGAEDYEEPNVLGLDVANVRHWQFQENLNTA